MSVKQFKHILDWEFCRGAKMHSKPTVVSQWRDTRNGDTKGHIATLSLVRDGNNCAFGLIESKSTFLI